MTKALVVLSGGQDSTTCLFWAVRRYGSDNVRAVTFNYGQRHTLELESARRVAQLAQVNYHEIIDIGPILAGTSPLTDHSKNLEQYQDAESMAKIIGNRVETTFVPMRNALFLTLAANRAVVWECGDIVTGVSQEDNANYPDCRSAFIISQRQTINEALGNNFEGGIQILTPLLYKSKPESVHFAWDIPGAYGALAYSHTAYDGMFPPVGRDHATLLRAQGFEQSGRPDPLILRAVAIGMMEYPPTKNYTDRNSVLEAVEHIKNEPWFSLGKPSHRWVYSL